MRRWERVRPLAALVLALLLALGLTLELTVLPGLGGLGGRPAAASGSAASGPGGNAGSPPAAPASQGAYQLGKVRILGVPVITVASPVVSPGGNGPDAATRAQVIEGNLELLYRARNLCSGGEVIADALVRTLLDPTATEACGLANASLLGKPEALSVAVRPVEGGLHRLEARVPGRSQPLPLLTVTPEDALLNGLDNGALAERWRTLLERRLHVARRLMQPRALQQRLQRVLLTELLLAVLVALGLGLWQLSRRGVGQLERRYGLEERRRRQGLAIHGLHGLSRALLVGVMVLLLAMVGVATFAVPGRVPTALDLLLQPWGIALKLALLWAVALAARLLLGLWLSQWVGNVDVPPERRQRRRQRHLSLLRVLRRLVDLACLSLAGLWILSGIPGVQELSGRAVLASGALLGALAIVFQGLLRDFVAGLVILFDDRYAIGDTVEIHGLRGEVIDLGVLSTELRCSDQRVALFQNSRCGEVVNHTKLRSGAEVTLVLAHRGPELRRALATIRAVLEAFAADPFWQPQLLEAPQLRGVTAVGPEGITIALLLVTSAGAQGAAARELRLRLVERLRRAGIPLADAGTR